MVMGAYLGEDVGVGWRSVMGVRVVTIWGSLEAAGV